MKSLDAIAARYRTGIAIAAAIRSRKQPSESQTVRFIQAMAQMRITEEATRQVLDLAGVPTLSYPFYYAFVRQVYKLSRREIEGKALCHEVALLIGLWTGRGLSQRVLEIIRDQVFNIGNPTP